MDSSIARTKDDNKSDNMKSNMNQKIGRQLTFEPQYNKQLSLGQ